MLKQNIFEEVVINDYPPVDVGELAAASDLIVEVTIGAQRSFVDADGHTVWTDYGAQIVKTLQSRKASEPGGVIVVRKRGGSVSVAGRTFVSVDSGFTPFQAGEQYVLFLRAPSGSPDYEIVSGPSGACRIVDGSVTSTLSLAEFRDTVARQAGSRLSMPAQAAR